MFISQPIRKNKFIGLQFFSLFVRFVRLKFFLLVNKLLSAKAESNLKKC